MKDGYTVELRSPNGDVIHVTPEVYEAFKQFITPNQLPGMVQIHFNRGGITRVKATWEHVLKG